MSNGIDMGYSQKIADQTCGPASSTTVDRTAAHDIGHHEKIIHEPLRAYKIEFLGQAIFNCPAGLPVTPAYSPAALGDKKGEMVLVFIEVVRENGLETVPCGMAGFCDFYRVG